MNAVLKEHEEVLASRWKQRVFCVCSVGSIESQTRGGRGHDADVDCRCPCQYIQLATGRASFQSSEVLTLLYDVVPLLHQR
jgi:hypothetical protein